MTYVIPVKQRPIFKSDGSHRMEPCIEVTSEIAQCIVAMGLPASAPPPNIDPGFAYVATTNRDGSLKPEALRLAADGSEVVGGGVVAADCKPTAADAGPTLANIESALGMPLKRDPDQIFGKSISVYGAPNPPVADDDEAAVAGLAPCITDASLPDKCDPAMIAMHNAIACKAARNVLAAIKAGKVPGIAALDGRAMTILHDAREARDRALADLAACRAELAEITSKWYGVKAMYSDAAAACAALTAQRDELAALLRKHLEKRCPRCQGVEEPDERPCDRCKGSGRILPTDVRAALARIAKPETGKGGAP